MKETTLRTILIGVGLVLVAWGASTFLGGRGGNGATSSPLQKTLSGLHEAEIASVRVRTGSDTIRLRRAGDRWLANGWSADTATLEALWSAVDSSRVAELASRNPGHQGDMGVTDSAATELLFRRKAGDSVRLLIGHSGPYYPSAYVRLPGSDAVWLVRGRLRHEATLPADQWRDRTVLAVDTARVRSIEVARGDTVEQLARAESAWTVNGKPAGSHPISLLLDGLARVEASGFAPDTAQPGRTTRSVVARGANGDTLALLRFTSNGGSGYWATVPGDSVVYEIPAYRVDQLTPGENALRASAPVGHSPGGSRSH